METNVEIKEVIEEEESEFETKEEVEEILEEDEDDENFNSFPTMKDISHHEWLLKNPQPLWVIYSLALLIAGLERWYLEAFIDKTRYSSHDKEEGTLCLSEDDEKSNLKFRHTLELFKAKQDFLMCMRGFVFFSGTLVLVTFGL
ncbi:hypothetical protein Tco_1532050 [Tanacetum coccineum]